MVRYLDFVVIDTMAKTLFKGNPTPVVIVDHLRPWASVSGLQKIAREMNHLETMFARCDSDQDGQIIYDVRSFTPTKEIGFCGHGLLGVALVLTGRYPAGSELIFRLSDGQIAKAQVVLAQGAPEVDSHIPIGSPYGMIKLLIPCLPVTDYLNDNWQLRRAFADALGITPKQIVDMGMNILKDIVVELDHDVDFSAQNPNINATALFHASPPDTRSQIITSRGDRLEVDYLKRVFWEGAEDHATGSTHCALIPYWAAKLGKTRMKVLQLSERTGEVEVDADPGVPGFVAMIGTGVKVMEGRVAMPRSDLYEAKL